MTRLDAELVARGLARSRGHARDLIDHGAVRVTGRSVLKASAQVDDADEIVLDFGQESGAEPAVLDASWVSRASGKLLGALADLPGGGPPLQGSRAADLGACTGGFTQVLLRHGAAQVVAVDVGHDQLAAELRADPRVVDLSGHNVRDLTPDRIGGEVDLVVADLSFISLTLVMPQLTQLVRPDGDLLLLIKPQFEVGRAGLDGKGVVRPGRWRRQAVERVLRSALDAGLRLRHLVRSRTPGQDGNTEYVVWLARPGRAPDDASGIASWEAVNDTIAAVCAAEAPRTTGGTRA